MARSKTLQTENSRTVLTVSSQKENEPEKRTQFISAYIGTLSALSAGMCLSWSSSAIPLLQQNDSFLKVTDAQGSWLGSLITLGAFIGAIPAGSLASFCGRKRFLQYLSLLLMVSWLMLTFSGCIYGLYAARILAGLAIGGISVAAPMYVSELSHTSIRGTLGTFFQVQITAGLLIEYVLGGTVADFKLLALISAGLPVVFLLSSTFIPESPIFLYTYGKIDEAKQSLQLLRGNHYNIQEELMKISEDIAEANINKAQITDLINCKATLRAFIISFGLMIFQQLSGINAVLFYATDIFSESGSSMSPDICAILVGAVQFISTLISSALIEKAGRKLLLSVSAAIMFVCLIVLGAYFHLKQYHDLNYLSILPLISLTIFIVMFSIGFGPIPWLMMGEIFSPKIKETASSISAAFNWILAFIVTNQFQNMTSVFGTGMAFVVFGVISGIGLIFVLCFVPETKGRSIDEVQNILRGKSCGNCRKKCQNNTSYL